MAHADPQHHTHSGVVNWLQVPAFTKPSRWVSSLPEQLHGKLLMQYAAASLPAASSACMQVLNAVPSQIYTAVSDTAASVRLSWIPSRLSISDPAATKYAGGAAAVCVPAIALPLAAPVVIAALGFGSGGVVAGSVAAGVQSSIGCVSSGSAFALLQSAGAIGFSAASQIAMATAGAAVGAAGLALGELGRRKFGRLQAAEARK